MIVSYPISKWQVRSKRFKNYQNVFRNTTTWWKEKFFKFYWNEKYFSDLLQRLQSNSDIDPIVVAGDKKNYLKMKKENPNKIIAGRSYHEIIERFERKINDPRVAKSGKYSAKIIKEFLKIKCPLKDAPKN